MKFLVSSPDSLLFDRSEFGNNKSRTEQIAVSMLALVALSMQIGVFIMIHSLMKNGMV